MAKPFHKTGNLPIMLPNVIFIHYTRKALPNPRGLLQVLQFINSNDILYL